MSDEVLSCPKCGEPAPVTNHFCEACGNLLGDPPPDVVTITSIDPTLCRCGAGPDQRDSDGFCLACGRKFEPRDPRDHTEETIGDRLAAVTDRGIRHKRNEDDFAIGIESDAYALVVCDGVSTSSNSNLASRAASIAARDVLVEALKANSILQDAMAQAILTAHNAASNIPIGEDGHPEPPGATIVAATVKDGVITLGWAGDSRAYWLSAEGSRQLSKDHSWMEQVVDAGKMTREQALHDSRAHAITQCIGLLNEGPPEASFSEFKITAPGHLLLCSDGLWGYMDAPDALNEKLGTSSPLYGAQEFVKFAIDRGGVDNVTAVILSIDPQ